MIDISILVWLGVATLAIILLYVVTTPLAWRRRVVMGEIIAALAIVGLPFLFTATLPVGLLVFLGFVQLGLVMLAGRLIFGRLEDAFLRISTKLNTAFATLLLVLSVFAVLLVNMLQIQLDLEILAATWAIGSMALGLVLLAQTIWSLRHYKLRNYRRLTKLKDMPTVTLAIPARNETHALTDCLAAAVASDYTKLEIIVLDDCSQDKTSQIIRAFAHDGVRFISGKTPAEGWLGKNQACEALAEEAQGEYILFAGVDTLLAPHSITDIVSYAVSHELSMVSVLPQTRARLHTSTLLQQLRYFWQIALPITKHRVPVATQCWLIRSDALRNLGGFGAVRHKIVPEGWFARRLASIGLYRFAISNNKLGVTTAKRWHSQAESALRFLYPTFKRQPLYVLCGVLLLATVLAPFGMLLWSVLTGEWTALLGLFGAASLLWIGCYLLVVVRTNPRSWPLTAAFFPAVVVQDVVLLIVSMLLYEFGEVNWKGRNVCYPVITLGQRTKQT